MKEHHGVVLLENSEQWRDFQLNSKRSPSRYPVIAWYENHEFGLAGDANVSFFSEIPEAVVEMAAAGALDAYVLGFREGIRRFI